MNSESIRLFLLLIAPFAIALLLEALVIYLFKLRSFIGALGFSIVLNLVSLVLLFGFTYPLGKIGYEFNGLQLPLQVMFFLWWLSIMAEGFLLHLFLPQKSKQSTYLTAMVMNTVSFLFVYFFVSISH